MHSAFSIQHSAFFKDLKVIELASVLAGPAVGMFFAELGAEVVKIENKKTGGDMTRGWKLAGENPDAAHSAYFCSVNWGKRHLFLDLDDPTDRTEALALIAEADLVIVNFKPSSARRMGLDAETLRRAHPRLIYAQLQAWADPEDERPAFDVVLQAEAGFMYMNGPADGLPAKMPVALIDLLAAHQLKEAVLVALLHRERTGEGCTVTASLYESAVASLANQASNWLMTGHIPQRMGTLHPNIAPYGDVFTCADDRPVLLAVGTERQFVQLCNTLNLNHLLSDPDFQVNTQRVKNRSALCHHLAQAIARFTADEVMTLFEQTGVPAARIRDMESVLTRPEAQALVLEETLPDGTPTRRIRTAVFRIDQ